jgi:hypothetical protein
LSSMAFILELIMSLNRVKIPIVMILPNGFTNGKSTLGAKPAGTDNYTGISMRYALIPVDNASTILVQLTNFWFNYLKFGGNYHAPEGIPFSYTPSPQTERSVGTIGGFP